MIQRTFIVGGEWIYFKIYSGPKTIENIFINDIMREVNLFIEKGIVDSYFFIRYMDPNYHLRLRLHCSNIDNYGYILHSIYKSLNCYVQDLIITKVQLDTYSRELERYEGDEIVCFEKIFYYDSCFVTKCLKKINCMDQDRYKIVMRFIDSIMDLCGFNLDEKISFTEKNCKAYFLEIYQSNNLVGNILNSEYRKVRNEMEKCLNAYDKYCWWHKEIKKCVYLMGSVPKNVLLNHKNELSSVIHMHVNRMYRINQRTAELVIYWYLNKYYRSKKALFDYQKENSSYL